MLTTLKNHWDDLRNDAYPLASLTFIVGYLLRATVG